MQLLLFCDRNNKLFLYDMSLCKEVNGKFVPRDESIRTMVKDTGDDQQQSKDPYMNRFDLVGSCFSNFTFINSKKFYNEFVIMRGVNMHGENVCLSLSLFKNEFQSFLERSAFTPCFFVNDSNYVGGGPTHDRTNKQLFCDLKANLKDLVPKKPDINSNVISFKFFNENGKIVDTVLSLCEVLAPTHLTPKMIKLR
ncbi:hypothetical protein [Ehrlichia canis]|uniref:Uncharacterized protein n=1 Tax=Ehrlichia canis (strain Jake) TaxID=269484 RepID=A0ACA6AVY0_EHRCJ|nr:hypothetical protein [Ehrlichia canis]AAZ68477.1 hypothetical protein Ecaj_0435 [Ehrlichia canis str. Jake]